MLEDFVVDVLSACVGFALSAAAAWKMAQLANIPTALRANARQ